MPKRETLPVNVDRLRRIETKMQGLATAVDFTLQVCGLSWKFILVVFEFGGGGISHVTSLMRSSLVERTRYVAASLRDLPDQSPIVKHVKTEGGASVASMTRLALLLDPLTAVIRRELLDGWGFCLLITPEEGEGYVYASDADRRDTVEALQEAADRWDRHEDRPPGRFGMDH